MTNEEAIIQLEYRKDFATPMQIEALNMGIKALEQKQKTGHWITELVPRTQPDNWDRIAIKCSECGVVRTRIMFNADTMDFDETVKDETTSEKQKNHYCFNCGAKMEGE